MESERASHRGEEAEGGWNSALMLQRRFLLFPTLAVVLDPLAVDSLVPEDDQVCAGARLR